VSSSEPKIPAKLLTRLLHHHFQNEKTKVAKDANTVVAKYVDVFVREAIARAAYERAEVEGAGGGTRAGDGFLEVCCSSVKRHHGPEKMLIWYHRWKILRKWRRSLPWTFSRLMPVFVTGREYMCGSEYGVRGLFMIVHDFIDILFASRYQIYCMRDAIQHCLETTTCSSIYT
jgi:hypothetical protein